MEKRKRVVQDGELLGNVEGLPKRVTERPAQKQRARRSHFFGDVAQDGNGHGRNARGFDCSLNQSHGPIAQPSSWREKNEVRLLTGQVGKQLRQDTLLQASYMTPVNVAHK